MEGQVILEAYHDSLAEEYALEAMEYPCVVISGITTEEEVEFFRKREAGRETSVPMYAIVEGLPMHVGKLDLVLESLLAVRAIFGYGLTLYRKRDDAVTIDLNDAGVLSKFIRL